MIKTFRRRDTELLFARGWVARFQSVERSAWNRLKYLDVATSLRDLAKIPGLRLELLKGARAGQHSIRINDQWRICFVWRAPDAYEVEIVDYH